MDCPDIRENAFASVPPDSKPNGCVALSGPWEQVISRIGPHIDRVPLCDVPFTHVHGNFTHIHEMSSLSKRQNLFRRAQIHPIRRDNGHERLVFSADEIRKEGFELRGSSAVSRPKRNLFTHD